MSRLNETKEDASACHQRVLTGSDAKDDTCTLVPAGCGLRAAKAEGGFNRGALNCDGYANEDISEFIFQFGRRHVIVGDHCGLCQQICDKHDKSLPSDARPEASRPAVLFFRSIDCASVIALFVRWVEDQSLTKTTRRSESEQTYRAYREPDRRSQ